MSTTKIINAGVGGWGVRERKQRKITELQEHVSGMSNRSVAVVPAGSPSRGYGLCLT